VRNSWKLPAQFTLSNTCNKWDITISMFPRYPRKIRSDKYVYNTQFSITVEFMVSYTVPYATDTNFMELTVS
jgi:hypothetical protein